MPNDSPIYNARLAFFATLLTFVVIVLGAYTRLTDAGLGCPDWPGCYGKIIVPKTSNLSQYPIIDATKAWIEMIHRYAASFLGLIILLLAALAIRYRRTPQYPYVLPLALLMLVIFQGLLGMWTVTLKLLPIVVTAHLLGGMMTLVGLWWLTLRLSISNHQPCYYPRFLKKLAFFALILLILQIILGAWTSTNYAALVCPDFPFCQGTTFNSFPALHVSEAFNVLQSSLSLEARMTVHVLHRMGAIFVSGMLGWLSVLAFKQNLKMLSLTILLLLMLQVLLGILNVWAFLPLSIAVSHNAVAALLLLTIVTLNYQLKSTA